MARHYRRQNTLLKIFQALVKRFTTLYLQVGKAGLRQLQHLLLQLQRGKRPRTAGFVLPTTVLMLLVLALTVGAMIHRAYSHSTQIIGESQQRVIYNAATPAIDRARAKLETLFDSNKDSRYPGGVPAQNYLAGMLRNDGSYSVNALTGAPATDIYTLTGETRINLDNQTRTGETRGEDNAWAYRTDTNGDGTADATVIYSILMQTPTDQVVNGQAVTGSGVVGTNDLTKAQNQWVRTAPLSNRQQGNCSTVDVQAVDPGLGWFQDSTSSSVLRKNFQIDAMVIPDGARTRPNFVTLEMQQDRQLDRGNKWGAWFRNDLEIYPGVDFNWNGAMHTEGNLMIRPNGGSFTAYLVSARNSCLMSTSTSSEVTVTNITNTNNVATQAPDFIGGILSGTMRENGYGGSSTFHIWPAPAPNGTVTAATLDTTTDSSTGTANPAEMSLDPTDLLTRDVSLARGTNKSNRSNVTAGWQLRQTDDKARIYNQSEPKPYVDDLYRADDRWGPKPKYSDKIVVTGAAQQPGTLITAANAGSNFNDLTNNTVVAGNAANVGLDGYWERRARVEGARIIVGQRLELGNMFGWTGANEALYPADSTSITHQQRQRRTLRDNLAAVQASAIYHSGNPAAAGGVDFPVACLASTSHPGSLGSLANSIKFNSANPSLTNFLIGSGTNGWEFAAPATNETNFITAIGSAQPLGKALRNLAYFAGDYVTATRNGAFPPTQETGFIHPYPNLTMWGNFAELRRTLARLDGGTTYTDLSIADKTNLHTAACTLGMLAYNINALRNYDFNIAGANKNDSGNRPGLSKLGTIMAKLVDGGVGNNNGEVKDPATGNYLTVNDGGTQKRIDQINGNLSSAQLTELAGKYSNLPSEAFVNALLTEDLGANYTTAERLAMIDLARSIISRNQIDRDRTFGFKTNAAPPYSATTTWATTGKATGKIRSTEVEFTTSCDPKSFDTNNGASDNAQRDQLAALALSFCDSTPRYPALFYLFPKVAHDHDGDVTQVVGGQSNVQPTSEPYIADTYIASTVNSGVTYRVVGGTGATPTAAEIDDFTGVALTPKASDFSNWLLPNIDTTTAPNSPNRILVGTTQRAVGFLERAIFNGREMMMTRVMDIDLDLLRSRSISGGTTGQPWLPTSGIIYAFREDAAREDGIARPASGTQTNATNSTSQTDPALVTTTTSIQISPKQVDYIADPARRPHGFRLRNGAQLQRAASFGISSTDNVRGLSFFTDDPVYIQGDFNLHANSSGARLEEFTEQMNGDYSSFYNRQTRDTNFARPTTDRWRPSEILADAVTILSNNFCDGSIQDTFFTPTASSYHNTTTPGLWGPGCTGSSTSFTNQNLPGTGTWLWENTSDTATSNMSGVRIDRNGNPVVSGNTAYSGSYQAFSDGKSRTAAANTTVNSIIVSGIVPSQANQGYGGLHNFPRFIEDWSGKTLQFNGSFLQLSFSNYATGPFDQDAWEPGAAASSDENIKYYEPPTRAWGYDTALQLAPAGPAARRFVTASRNRNEFYTEAPASDAFMKQLCTAFNNTGKAGVLANAPASVPCP